MTSIRIAVVQSSTETADPPKNVQRALAHVEQAAAQGARIICLPETYPGPWTPPVDYDALPGLEAQGTRSGRVLDRGHARGGTWRARPSLQCPSAPRSQWRDGGRLHKVHGSTRGFVLGLWLQSPRCAPRLRDRRVHPRPPDMPRSLRSGAVAPVDPGRRRNPLHARRPVEDGAMGYVARAYQSPRYREPLPTPRRARTSWVTSPATQVSR